MSTPLKLNTTYNGKLLPSSRAYSKLLNICHSHEQKAIALDYFVLQRSITKETIALNRTLAYMSKLV